MKEENEELENKEENVLENEEAEPKEENAIEKEDEKNIENIEHLTETLDEKLSTEDTTKNSVKNINHNDFKLEAMKSLGSKQIILFKLCLNSIKSID